MFVSNLYDPSDTDTNTYLPNQPLHNRDIVSVHFNNCFCMGICDKLTWHLSMLPYIYLNVDEYSLTSSIT